jgi:hypothetical protein
MAWVFGAGELEGATRWSFAGGVGDDWGDGAIPVTCPSRVTAGGAGEVTGAAAHVEHLVAGLRPRQRNQPVVDARR